VPGWGTCTRTSHPDNTLIPHHWTSDPPLLLYPSNSSFLPSFPFLFPFVEFTGSRSPAPVPRERDHDIRDAKRESREHLYESDPRHSDWERSRPYERSHGPKSTQDYASGRRRPIEPDVDPPRGRDIERERVRGERLERDRDVHNPRREVNNGIDADQRSQGDAKSKRTTEEKDRKLESLLQP
jgi:hypothetical protein